MIAPVLLYRFGSGPRIYVDRNTNYAKDQNRDQSKIEVTTLLLFHRGLIFRFQRILRNRIAHSLWVVD